MIDPQAMTAWHEIAKTDGGLSGVFWETKRIAQEAKTSVAYVGKAIQIFSQFVLGDFMRGSSVIRRTVRPGIDVIVIGLARYSASTKMAFSPPISDALVEIVKNCKGPWWDWATTWKYYHTIGEDWRGHPEIPSDVLDMNVTGLNLGLPVLRPDEQPLFEIH